MALGSLFDPDSQAGSAAVHLGPRPFLTRAHMIGLRLLIAIYVPTLVLITVANYGPVGSAVFRLSTEHLWAAVTIGIAVVVWGLTLLLLFGMSLYHYLRGHTGPQPPSWWLWVILLLNVVGVVAYYLRVIEPEQNALIDRGRAS